MAAIVNRLRGGAPRTIKINHLQAEYIYIVYNLLIRTWGTHEPQTAIASACHGEAEALPQPRPEAVRVHRGEGEHEVEQEPSAGDAKEVARDARNGLG